MTIRKIRTATLILGSLLPACRTQRAVEPTPNSEVKTSMHIPGQGVFEGFQAKFGAGTITLTFYEGKPGQTDFKQERKTMEITRTGDNLNIPLDDGSSIEMGTDPDTKYGFLGILDDCTKAWRLLKTEGATLESVDPNDFDPALIGKPCWLEFSSEGQSLQGNYWYSAAVKPFINEGEPANPALVGAIGQFQQGIAGAMAAGKLPAPAFPNDNSPLVDPNAVLSDNRIDLARLGGVLSKVANPLRPVQHVATKFTPELRSKILAAMVTLHEQHQSDSDLGARNACLKNARAYQWLDLQSHFYCLLPYDPWRTCYSTRLVELTKGIGALDDPRHKIALLQGAYWVSHAECVSSKGKHPLSARSEQLLSTLCSLSKGSWTST